MKDQPFTNWMSGGPWVAALCVLVGCSPDPESESDTHRPVQTLEVSEPVTTVRRVLSGQLAASEGTGIGFQVGGRISSLPVRVGERVTAGEPIAELDSTDYDNQLADARAQFQRAKQELDRTQQLFVLKNATKSQLDAAIATHKSTQAAFRVAEKRVKDCRLLMPYTGVIGALRVEEQSLVNPGQEILTIQGELGLEFEVGVPADIVSEFSEGMKGEILVGGRAAVSYPATISEVSPQVSNNTTYPVTFTLDRVDEWLRPGMDGVAELELPSPHPSFFTLPSVCVRAEASGEAFVWVVKTDGDGATTGMVERRTVTTGTLREGGTLEILSGLHAGDLVVSRGVNRLEPGLAVRLLEPTRGGTGTKARP